MKKGVSARGGAGLKGLTAVVEDVPKIRPTYSQTEYHGKVWGAVPWVDWALKRQSAP